MPYIRCYVYVILEGNKDVEMYTEMYHHHDQLTCSWRHIGPNHIHGDVASSELFDYRDRWLWVIHRRVVRVRRILSIYLLYVESRMRTTKISTTSSIIAITITTTITTITSTADIMFMVFMKIQSNVTDALIIRHG